MGKKKIGGDKKNWGNLGRSDFEKFLSGGVISKISGLDVGCDSAKES